MLVQVERPTHHVELVNALVAELAVAVVPLPMPLVVQAQIAERAVGSGAFPQVVMDARGNRPFLVRADAVAPFVGEAAGQVNLADQPLLELLNALDDFRAGAVLRAVLNDAAVTARGADGLLAFESIVRERLFDIDVLARLAGPYRAQRVPVIRRGLEHHVDRLVFEQLADVVVNGGLVAGAFDVVAETLGHDRLVDVAQRGQLDVLGGEFLDGGNVRAPPAAQADHRRADAVVGAQPPGGKRRRAEHRGAGGRGRGRANEFSSCRVAHGWSAFFSTNTSEVGDVRTEEQWRHRLRFTDRR